MARRRRRHPDNVPGDFYVEDGCCTLCGVPEQFAPDLFPPIDDDSEHCFVRKQPTSTDEVDRMFEVIACAELDCIRYAGSDRAILTRLCASGHQDLCDNLPDDLRPAPRGIIDRWLAKLRR